MTRLASQVRLFHPHAEEPSPCWAPQDTCSSRALCGLSRARVRVSRDVIARSLLTVFLDPGDLFSVCLPWTLCLFHPIFTVSLETTFPR